MACSLVLPCYKPAPGWEQQVLAAYRSFCGVAGDAVELILVVDGQSATVTDASLSFLEQQIAAVKIVKYEENRGKGYALRAGVTIATGEIIMYTDIDFPYTMASMKTVYDSLNSNDCEVAIGIKDEAYYAHVPRVRRMISRFLRLLTGVFLSMPVTDTQCGLKGFRRQAAPVFLQTKIDRYLFDLEFVHNCFRGRKYRVKAIPVSLNENVRFRRMDYRILLPEMVNFIKLLFK